MDKNITLREGIETGLIKKDDYISYHADRQKICLMPDETGYKIRQNYETQTLNYQFQFVDDVGNIAIVSDKSIKEKVTLKGKKGTAKCQKTLNRLCEKIFSNSKLKAKAHCINLEEYKKLSQKMKKLKSFYWLSTQFAYDEKTKYGVYYVYADNVIDQYLCNSEDQELDKSYSIRVVVLLPGDIVLDTTNPSYDGSTAKRAWKIKSQS